MSTRPHQVGIPEATDATGRTFAYTRIVAIHHDAPYQRPLHCGHCEALVVAVNGYTNRNGNRVVSHFRLAKGHDHTTGCVFDFAAHTLDLSRRHPEVVKATAHGLELSVDALMAGLARGDEIAPPNARNAVGPRLQARNTTPALVDIVRLLDRYGFDPQAQLAFSVFYRDRRLSWREFCFDAATEIKRFQRTLIDDSSIPRLLVGVVSSIHQSSAGDAIAADIMVRRQSADAHRPVFSSAHRPILPVLRAAGRDVLDFAEGDCVAAFDIWQLFGRLEQPTLWLGSRGDAVAL